MRYGSSIGSLVVACAAAFGHGKADAVAIQPGNVAAEAAAANGPEPTPAELQAAAQAAAAASRAHAQVLAEKRRALFEHEQKLRLQDAECVKLRAEIDELQKQVSEREEALRTRLAADPEWTRLQGEAAAAQREQNALQQRMMVGMRLAAGTNVVSRPQRPVMRPPSRDTLGNGGAQ